MSDNEEKQSDPGLIQNLGTSPIDMDKGEIDWDLFSVLNVSDIPFALWLRQRGKRSNAYKSFYQGYMKMKVSINGKGRRQVIQGEMVRKGGNPNLEAEVEKPGWVERNILNRDWEKKQKEELGIE